MAALALSLQGLSSAGLVWSDCVVGPGFSPEYTASGVTVQPTVVLFLGLTCARSPCLLQGTRLGCWCHHAGPLRRVLSVLPLVNRLLLFPPRRQSCPCIRANLPASGGLPRVRELLVPHSSLPEARIPSPFLSLPLLFLFPCLFPFSHPASCGFSCLFGSLTSAVGVQ